MKTLIRLLALMAALSVGWAANAQSSLAGYEFVTGTAEGKWETLTNTTNLLGSTSGDHVASTVQNIGFSFPFGGNTYTKFSVNADGNLRLGGTATGTGSYDIPFSSSNAGNNGPKINFFGCDGYFVAGTHYVRAQKFSSVNYDYLVVEFCLGTYSTGTRNVQYKWQVQLCQNGSMCVVFPSSVPSSGPEVRHQMGLCVNASDGWIINSSNQASHFTNGDTNRWAAGSWPDANRYYEIYRDNCITIPSYNNTITPSTSWQTYNQYTTFLYSTCRKKILKVHVDPGYTYTFKTGCGDGATADFDTKLYLYNGSGSQLESNDDGCEDHRSKIVYSATSSTNLYLEVTGYNYETGYFGLAYKKECTSIPNYHYSISPTTSYQTHSSNNTDSCNNSRIYRIYVSAADVADSLDFIFKTGGGNNATANFDTKLSLYNSSGTLLATNDDAFSGNYLSYIVYRPKQSGNMYLEVEGYNSAATGNYTLAYKKGCVSIPDYHYTISPSSSWQTHSSQISGTTECTQERLYRIYVEQGYGYTFKTGNGDGASSSFYSGLYLYDENGNIKEVEVGGVPLVYIPSQSGYVYLEVTKYLSNTYGNFTLAYKRDPAYTVTVNPNPTMGGQVSIKYNGIYNYRATETQKYISGKTCEVNAMPDVGYVFTNWTVGSTVVSTSPEYSFTVTSNRDLKANFTYTGNCTLISNNYHDEYLDRIYDNDFDSYTTSTTPKTGIQPTCWTLAHQDVPMTDDYKPMIYYSPENAFTGNYSLILNKRCIYAMPYVDNLRKVELQFNLKQNQTKYQLQVGIMTDLNDESTFIPYETFDNPTTDFTWHNITFSNTRGHYIAFRNVLAPGYTGDYSVNYIDCVTLSHDDDACLTIRDVDLPFTDNFDSYTSSTTSKTGVEPDCWWLAKEYVTMTDEYKPMIYYSYATSHSGYYSLCLNKRCIYSMPYYNGNIRDLKLDFYLKQPDAKYQLQVGVLIYDWGDIYFTPITTINNSGTGYVHHTVDFSSYTGSGHYIAFRNVLASGETGDYSVNYIDDLHLETRCSIYPGELPFTDNFDSYTTSHTAKTGVQPDCWTLAKQDVTMTDEYKPMIYYASTNAHSGNYSLLLNKRGIYAMPEYSGNVKNLQLRMYLKQSQTKYQLQVGVMTSLTNASSFVPVATLDNSGTGYVQHTVNFSSYTGSGHYIAFRNVLPSGQTGDFSCNYIDDLTLSIVTNYIITASANPSAGGSVSGAGTFASGSTCTLHATPASGYTFTNWTSGSTVVSSNATYSFTVTANRTLKANFSPVANCGIAVADLPYSDNFDSYTTSTTAKTGVQPPCWTLAKQDVSMTDEYKPMIYYGSASAHSGNYALLLNKRSIYAMPEFEGNVNTLTLSMYLRQSQTKYQLQVGVMTSLSNPSSFVTVATFNNSGTGYVLRTVDFSSYTGSGHYIAFRNVLPSGQTGDYSCNYIDDLTLSVNTPSCTLHVADLPYTDNFDSYTSSTTAKTGVEPPCWTLAKQDVTMTDEYKPMVYYGSATAHSGNYSLILNKRGIYAMPEFEGNVNTLTLSMYLRQSQTKYQLQVGVMTSLSNPSSFVTVATFNNSGTGYVLRTVDFSSYTGSGHYIAFRNVLPSGQTGDYSCNYIDDLTLSVNTPSCTLHVADLPYTDNFDSYTSSTTAKTGVEPPCWTLAKQDVTMTDEYKPMVYYGSSSAHSGNYALLLNKRGIYAMPYIDGSVKNLQLSMYLRQSQTKYQLQVGVMTSLSNPSSFVTVATLNNSGTAYVLRTVDFSSYTGSGHYIAFRNVLPSGQTGDFSCNYIDDLRLETRCSIYPDEIPFTDNFDSYTSSTTAKTGVQPDCWTLAHQDVTMTDEYKPMIYYGSSTAYSGNYSLILNKRGIYAMPRFTGNVNNLQLSFYLKQTQTKYQLQVGVMSSLSDASTFVPVATFNNTSTTSFVLRTVNFSSYTGSGHYIAFRNILASGQTGDYSCNYIDNINLCTASKGDMPDDSYGMEAPAHTLTLYPNPTTGILNVEADEEVVRVDVFDYTGRCVASFERQTTVDLGRLATGLYTLRVTLPERIEVRRVVKQ